MRCKIKKKHKVVNESLISSIILLIDEHEEGYVFIRDFNNNHKKIDISSKYEGIKIIEDIEKRLEIKFYKFKEIRSNNTILHFIDTSKIINIEISINSVLNINFFTLNITMKYKDFEEEIIDVLQSIFSNHEIAKQIMKEIKNSMV